MEISREDQQALLGLNDKQKALLAELKDLNQRMKQAKLVVIFDSFECTFAAVNGEHIEDVDFEDTEESVLMHPNLDNWGNIDVPQDFDIRSTYGDVRITFDEETTDKYMAAKRERDELNRIIDSALNYC